MSTTTVYCRLCAVENHSDTMINFSTATIHHTDVTEKLAIFSDNIVDFDNKNLPEYVCEVCFKSLEFIYKFYVNAKASQDLLENVFSNANLVENNGFVEDNDHQDYETQFEEAPPPSWSTYPWTCAHCDLTIDSLTNLRDHTKKHHNTCYGYTCVDCDEKVDELEEFVKHVVGHREELRKYCEQCNIQTDDPTHRETHLDDHCCTFCGETFTDESTLLSHLKQFVTKSTGLLAFDVSIYESYDTREIKCWSDYPSICKFCKIRMFNKEHLISHCMSVHESCFGHQCVDCSLGHDTFMDFVEHVYTHRPELKRYCPYCDVLMCVEYDTHIHSAHLNTHTHNTHACNLCGEIFTHKKKLRRHELQVKSPFITPLKKKRKTPLTEKDLTCNICGAILKSETSFKAHENLHKVREKEYTCEQCGLAYYTKGALNAHRKIHDKTREHCKICKKTFLNITRLRKHVQTHSSEKPFQCDHCKKNFSSKERLRSHISLHMDILPFICSYCNKKFRFRSLLKVHINQHTGARPYSCSFCEMDFSNWSNCNKHMKRKHNTTLAKSVMTPQGKILINPKTGKPYQLEIDSVVKEWSEKILSGKYKNKKHKN